MFLKHCSWRVYYISTVTQHQHEHDLSICGCLGNCQLSESNQYKCYRVMGPLYEWHCYLPGKNNILTAVIPGTMTCSLLAHENLSCQTVKRKPAFTNISQNCLQYLYCKRGRKKKKQLRRKLNHCQYIDCHLAREEREQMKKGRQIFYCCIVN